MMSTDVTFHCSMSSIISIKKYARLAGIGRGFEFSHGIPAVSAKVKCTSVESGHRRVFDLFIAQSCYEGYFRDPMRVAMRSPCLDAIEYA